MISVATVDALEVVRTKQGMVRSSYLVVRKEVEGTNLTYYFIETIKMDFNGTFSFRKVVFLGVNRTYVDVSNQVVVS